MNVLVLGGGAREHAIVWKLAQSPRAPLLFAAPGNAGTAAFATNLDVKADDVDGVLAAAREHAIDLTIVGPEAPLVAGMVDRFREEGLAIFGPTKAAARIETSKAFAKQLMVDANVPTAPFAVFDNPAPAKAYVRGRAANVVVKADGLAAGKGVVVARTTNDALQAVDDMMIGGAFGDAGARVLIEDRIHGQEVSVFTFTDGDAVSPLVAACDYKRVFDGDGGPNTGGMGGYSPPPFWTPELERELRETCIIPVVRALADAGSPYTGVLYGGLMLTEAGPMVLEFNARFGDPEAEIVLPRLENDLLDVIDAVLEHRVDSLDLRWSKQSAVGVVMASGGYPGTYETGRRIDGLLHLPTDTVAFHAGTEMRDESVVTAGGRVLTVVGVGETMADARALAYGGVAGIEFQGAHFRRDIAKFAAPAG